MSIKELQNNIFTKEEIYDIAKGNAHKITAEVRINNNDYHYDNKFNNLLFRNDNNTRLLTVVNPEQLTYNYNKVWYEHGSSIVSVSYALSHHIWQTKTVYGKKHKIVRKKPAAFIQDPRFIVLYEDVLAFAKEYLSQPIESVDQLFQLYTNVNDPLIRQVYEHTDFSNCTNILTVLKGWIAYSRIPLTDWEKKHMPEILTRMFNDPDNRFLNALSTLKRTWLNNINFKIEYETE